MIEGSDADTISTVEDTGIGGQGQVPASDPNRDNCDMVPTQPPTNRSNTKLKVVTSGMPLPLSFCC